MHLSHVYIFSNQSAQMAQDKINEKIAEHENPDYTVNFDLQIENSVAATWKNANGTVVKYSETRYTLVVYIYSLNAEV